jgi:hypothetical protein
MDLDVSDRYFLLREDKAAREPASTMMSIPEFCRAHRISKALFYKLRRQGLAPPVCKAGSRSLISVEAAAQWRRGLERGRS